MFNFSFYAKSRNHTIIEISTFVWFYFVVWSYFSSNFATSSSIYADFNTVGCVASTVSSLLTAGDGISCFFNFTIPSEYLGFSPKIFLYLFDKNRVRAHIFVDWASASSDFYNFFNPFSFTLLTRLFVLLLHFSIRSNIDVSSPVIVPNVGQIRQAFVGLLILSKANAINKPPFECPINVISSIPMWNSSQLGNKTIFICCCLYICCISR